MKSFFLLCIVCLAGLSALAFALMPEKDSRGKTVLTWSTDDNPARREQRALFARVNKNLEVVLDPSPPGLEKNIVQSIGGVGPDLLDSYDPSQLTAYVKSGIAWDITDELKKSGIDINGVWPVAREVVQQKGRVYGFPTNAGTWSLMFHKDLFDKAGVPYPKGPITWKELIPIAQKMTVRDRNGKIRQYGILFSWEYFWQQFIWQEGGRLYTPDGTRCVADSPEAIRATHFMLDLIYKHKITPTPSEEANMATQGGWGSGVITLFGAKKGAMALGSRFWLCTLRDYDGLKLGACECPHTSKRVFLGLARATLINKLGKRREQALEFVKFLASKPYNDLINSQADALGAVIKYCYTDEYIHNPKYPLEDHNEVYRDQMSLARSSESSQFVSMTVANRILYNQLSMIRTRLKTPEDGLRDAARSINAEIQKSIDRDPSLMAEYKRLTGRGWN